MNLAQLKNDHRIIFCTQLDGLLIYWRALTIREHDIYTKILTLELTPIGKIEDEIFREIVLDPAIINSMNSLPAGIIFSISHTALFVSGNQLQTEEDRLRINSDIAGMRDAVLSNPYEQFLILICKAFPTYTPSELEHLEFQELLRLLVMAEQIIGLEKPIELTPPEKEKSITDRLFADRHAAEQSDFGRPSAVDIRDLLSEKQKPDLSLQQARQIEMINKMRSRGRG